MPDIIYEPKGRAREYSPLACNLFTGCQHGCEYCYAPAVCRQTKDAFHADVKVKDNWLARLSKDAMKLRGDHRDILFSFLSDPYQSVKTAAIMEQAFEICECYDLRVQVLTKNPAMAIPHFPIFKRNHWKLGVTICFDSEVLRELWEPGAPTIESRYKAIEMARGLGVYTWISVEPVVDFYAALRVMSKMKYCVDLWKVGKWNHSGLANEMDWTWFFNAASDELHGYPVIWKDDLLEAVKHD